MKTREEICQEMKELFFEHEDIIAVWEGGSAATGYLDQYSDLDLGIVVDDDKIEEMFAYLDAYLERTFGIIRKFRVPEPTWHGMSQTYYQVDQVPELFYIDIALIKRTLTAKFTESDRHGNSVIWFEKEKMVDPTPTPAEEVLAKGKKFYKMVTVSDFIAILEVKKAIARNLYTEAFPAYYQFIARNLGIMFNLKHRPCKVDFGTRYAYRDYSPEDYAYLTDCMKVGSIDEMSVKFQTAEKVYLKIKEELGKEWGE